MDVRVGLGRKLSTEKLMLLNCGVGEDSWESLGLQGDPTSPSWKRSVLSVHWKDWCWSWNSSTLATWCEELTHWKRPWWWEELGAGGEGDDRGWDGWMASPTRWAWVWVNSGDLWWTGRPGVLRFMGSQRVGHNWATELNWTEKQYRHSGKCGLESPSLLWQNYWRESEETYVPASVSAAEEAVGPRESPFSCGGQLLCLLNKEVGLWLVASKLHPSEPNDCRHGPSTEQKEGETVPGSCLLICSDLTTSASHTVILSEPGGKRGIKSSGMLENHWSL